MSDGLLYVFQILGVVAFAISGALVAIDKKMDIFGVIILGIVTATGGGFIRDLSLGITPPLVFVDPTYAICASITSVIVFLKPVRNLIKKEENIFDTVLIVVDSLGLSLFAMTGIQIAYGISSDYNIFFLCFVGLITGTGGSILRDIMSQNMPYIFKKHFYACAAIAGSLIASLLWERTGSALAMAIGASVIFTLRMFAAYFHWELPHA